MILNDKNEKMQSDDMFIMQENTLAECIVDPEWLETGLRSLDIPEGVRCIQNDAFNAYNTGNVTEHIFQISVHRTFYLNDWKKQLSRKQIVRLHFPEGTSTLEEKADYMLQKERNVRLRTLCLPASLEKIEVNALPVLLDEILVDEANQTFISKEGVLFSRDGKRLIRYPGLCVKESYVVPEGVESIEEGAFSQAVLKKLVLPSTLKVIDSQSLAMAAIDELIVSEGTQIINRETFYGSRILSIQLSESLSCIEDYAFTEISGLRKFECASEALQIGAAVFSKCRFENIAWWCWSEIPKAAFLNSSIQDIVIPDGVVSIADYAFAGCGAAKKIVLPKSLREVQKNSFALGSQCRTRVTLPEHAKSFRSFFPNRIKVSYQ